MISGLIHRLSGTDELADFRTTTKIMANLITDHRFPAPPPWGRFPMKQVNEEIIYGNPTLRNLMLWYRWYPTAYNRIQKAYGQRTDSP